MVCFLCFFVFFVISLFCFEGTFSPPSLAAAIALPSFLAPANSQAKTEADFYKGKNSDQVVRIYGKDKYETNSKVLADTYDAEDTDTLVLASGKDFADALSAYNVSKKESAPVVLTDGTSYSGELKANVEKYSPKKVVLVGGDRVISKDLEKALKNAKDGGQVEVVRLAGKDRYETNKETLKDFGAKHAALVSGQKFPDALSASALLSQEGWALALADEKSQIPQGFTFTQIGGNKAIEDDSRITEKLIGRNRYETNELINAKLNDSKHTVFVSGKDFPDALSAISYTRFPGLKIVLVDGEITKDQIDNAKGTYKTIVGGDRVVKYSDEAAEVLPIIDTKAEDKTDAKDDKGNGGSSSDRPSGDSTKPLPNTPAEEEDDFEAFLNSLRDMKEFFKRYEDRVEAGKETDTTEDNDFLKKMSEMKEFFKRYEDRVEAGKKAEATEDDKKTYDEFVEDLKDMKEFFKDHEEKIKADEELTAEEAGDLEKFIEDLGDMKDFFKRNEDFFIEGEEVPTEEKDQFDKNLDDMTDFFKKHGLLDGGEEAPAKDETTKSGKKKFFDKIDKIGELL